MGVIDTVEWQFFEETTWGTSGTATKRLLGITEGNLTPKVPTKVIRQIRGSRGPGSLAARESTAGEGSVKGVATYEHINYWLENLLGKITPTGAGPYVRAGAAPLAAAFAPRLMTLFKGDTDGVYKLEGALVDGFTLECEQSESDSEATFEVKLLGKDVVTGTLAAALSDDSLTPIMAADWSIWIDPIATAPGTTQVQTTIRKLALKLSAGRVLKPYLGSLAPGGWEQPGFASDKQSLALTMEFNATSKAYLDALLGASTAPKNIRLKALNGTNIMQFDLGCVAKDAPELFNDADGVKTLEIEYNVLESSQAAMLNWLKYSNTCGQATL